MEESGKVYLVHVDIGLVSPTRLAGEDRIKEILGVQEMPKTMRALLAQEVIDRKLINPLEAIKGRVRNLLLKHGTRTSLLGWIVDPDQVDVVFAGIQKESHRFETEKALLLSRYEASCQAHLSALRKRLEQENVPGIDTEAFLAVIQNAQPTKRYIEARLNFAYLKPRAVELYDDEYRAIVLSVFDQSLVDIAAKARACLRLRKPNNRVEGLKEICGKLNGLSYLDARLRRVSEDIRATLVRMPTGIKDVDWPTPDQVVLDGVLSLLKSPALIHDRIDVMGNEVMFEDLWIQSTVLDLESNDDAETLDLVGPSRDEAMIPVVANEFSEQPLVPPTDESASLATAVGFSTW